MLQPFLELELWNITLTLNHISKKFTLTTEEIRFKSTSASITIVHNNTHVSNSQECFVKEENHPEEEEKHAEAC